MKLLRFVSCYNDGREEGVQYLPVKKLGGFTVIRQGEKDYLRICSDNGSSWLIFVTNKPHLCNFVIADIVEGVNFSDEYCIDIGEIIQGVVKSKVIRQVLGDELV